MNWVFVAFAAIAAGFGALCLWYRHKMSRERAIMAATPTTRAADVGKLPPGSVVEVKGSLRCTSPVTGEFSHRACVYFKAQIDRETVYYTTDSQGRRERKTSTETIHKNIKFAPCTVADDSGSVVLKIGDADVEGEQSFNERGAEPISGSGVLGALARIASSGDVTLIKTEMLMPADIPVYVLGEVQADGSVGKPAPHSNNKIFVVSNKSEEERSKSLAKKVLWCTIGTIVLFVGAAVLLYFALPGKTG